MASVVARLTISGPCRMFEENVLLVDGELLTRDLLGNHLRHMGFKVFAVETVSAALKLVPRGKFRLALLSDKIGEKQLKELVGRLRKYEADSLAFLVASRSHEAAYLESRRIYDLIVKPFRLEEVSIRLSHAVENISLRRALRASAEKNNQLERELAAFCEAADEVPIPDLSSLEDDGAGLVAGAETGAVSRPDNECVPPEATEQKAEDDVFEKIRKLDILRKAGILTPGEFSRKKKELLERI